MGIEREDCYESPVTEQDYVEASNLISELPGLTKALNNTAIIFAQLHYVNPSLKDWQSFVGSIEDAVSDLFHADTSKARELIENFDADNMAEHRLTKSQLM